MNQTLKKSSGNARAFVAGENAHEVREPYDIFDKDPVRKKQARDRVIKNYNHLMATVKDPGWRKIIQELAQTAEGQQMLANFPDNMEFNVTKELPDQTPKQADAVYQNDKNRLSVRPNNYNHHKNTRLDPHGTLLHEGVHAGQDNLGYIVGKGFSMQEVADNNYLIEADAKGQESKIEIMRQVFNTLKPSKDQIKRFMKEGPFYKDGPLDRKIEAELKQMKKSYEEAGEPFDEKAERAKLKKRTIGTDEYKEQEKFHKCLREAGGRLEKAKGEYAKGVFTSYLAGDNTNWSRDYAMQAIGVILHMKEKGELKDAGNPKAQDAIYSAIGKKYGLTGEQVKAAYKKNPTMQKSIDYIAKHPDYTDKQLMDGLERIFENANKEHVRSQNQQVVQNNRGRE